MTSSTSQARSFAPPSAAPRPISATDIEAAVREWKLLIGEPHVKGDRDARAHYARTTGVRSHEPLAVLHPESAAEVQAVVRVAGRYGIPLYPISRGKNWGYGDAAPSGENQVIVDLGRMNRIVEVNADLCYAVIEPGVTQGQLQQYLQAHHPNLWMDSSGAGPSASVVGNVLERGFGHTRYGDRFLQTCGMQVVLGDGRLLETGLGHFGNAKAHRAYRYGVGPFLDGIFSQSNYGVVTQMGVWLMPKPEAFSGYFLFSPDEASLPDLVDRLAKLRMQGLLQTTVHIANDLRVLAGRTRYPFERTGGKTPLPADVRAELREQFAVRAWSIAGAIYGTRETIAATRKALRRELAPYKVAFVDDAKIATATRMHRLLSRFGMGQKVGQQLEVIKPVYGLLKGIPTDEPLRGAGWRVRGPASATPTDPLDTHAGLMWVAPVLPASGRSAQELMKLLESTYGKYGFDTCVTFTLITERAMVCVSNIAFDRREADEAARAADCYHEVTSRLIAEGYIPYRTSATGAAALNPGGGSVFWDVAGDIKQALDPHRIISPGRYEPRAA